MNKAAEDWAWKAQCALYSTAIHTKERDTGRLRCVQPQQIAEEVSRVGNDPIELLRMLTIVDDLIASTTHNVYLATSRLNGAYWFLANHGLENAAEWMVRTFVFPRLPAADPEIYGMQRFKKSETGRHLLGVLFNLQEIRRWLQGRILAMEFTTDD